MSQLLNGADPLISSGQFPCDLMIILFTLVNLPGHSVLISYAISHQPIERMTGWRKKVRIRAEHNKI